MELLSGHAKIITKSGISLNAGTLNRGFTVYLMYRRSLVHVCFFVLTEDTVTDIVLIPTQSQHQ